MPVQYIREPRQGEILVTHIVGRLAVSSVNKAHELLSPCLLVMDWLKPESWRPHLFQVICRALRSKNREGTSELHLQDTRAH